MPDNLKRISPEDPKKINVNQPWELKRWANILGVTQDELKKIVKKVGPSVEKVKAFLQKYGGKIWSIYN